MVGKIVAIMAAASVIYFTDEAIAQQVCAPYQQVEQALANSKYHEKPVARALTDGGLVVIFAGKDGATWTVVLVRAKDQVACIGAVGTDWANVAALGEGS